MSGRTHIFAIGVEDCLERQIESVAFAENDAREFAAAWVATGVATQDCVSLLGSNATKAAVESSFKKFLRGVPDGDTVVFFFAGPGALINETSFLVLHDTRLNALHATGIPVADLLTQTTESKCSPALFFIDASSITLPEVGCFAESEFQDFCATRSDHFAYTACETNETSLKSIKLKHGIWSSAVISTLAGNASDALAEGNLLTTESLRVHLSAEIPRLIRSTRSGSETQSPRSYGSSPNPIVIADLTNLREARASESSALGSALKDTYLRGMATGSVRSLSGFRKGHRVPDQHFGAVEDFVRNIGHEKVQQQADLIFKDLRSVFAYRRKEVVFACADGAATIKTPDFDVDLSICQNPDDPGGYVATVEIGNIRTPEVVMGTDFSNVFSGHCDTVVISLSHPLDIEEKIDEIEAIPSLRGYLDYDAECTSFILKLASPSLTIHVAGNEITLQLRGSKDLKTLLNGLQIALGTLRDSGVLQMPAHDH